MFAAEVDMPQNPQTRHAGRSLKDRDTRKPQRPAAPVAGLDRDDPVDQASYDSFPASDPPAHSSRRITPGGRH